MCTSWLINSFNFVNFILLYFFPELFELIFKMNIFERFKVRRLKHHFKFHSFLFSKNLIHFIDSTDRHSCNFMVRHKKKWIRRWIKHFLFFIENGNNSWIVNDNFRNVVVIFVDKDNCLTLQPFSLRLLFPVTYCVYYLLSYETQIIYILQNLFC